MKSRFLTIAICLAIFPTALLADSFWHHNGSLMRLVAKGNQRFFYYEDPKPVLRKAGVRRGTLLFNGSMSHDHYEGVARRFSKYCPEAPLEYGVEGEVVRPQGQLKIVMRGHRPVNHRCEETGKIVEDTLVFTFLSKE